MDDERLHYDSSSAAASSRAIGSDTPSLCTGVVLGFVDDKFSDRKKQGNK